MFRVQSINEQAGRSPQPFLTFPSISSLSYTVQIVIFGTSEYQIYNARKLEMSAVAVLRTTVEYHVDQTNWTSRVIEFYAVLVYLVVHLHLLNPMYQQGGRLLGMEQSDRSVNWFDETVSESSYSDVKSFIKDYWKTMALATSTMYLSREITF